MSVNPEFPKYGLLKLDQWMVASGWIKILYREDNTGQHWYCYTDGVQASWEKVSTEFKQGGVK